MEIDLENLFNKLKIHMGENFVERFESVLRKTAKLPIPQLNMHSQKLEKYLNRMAEGKMSEEDFTVRMRDVIRLTEMESLRMEVETKAKAQQLIELTNDLISFFKSTIL